MDGFSFEEYGFGMIHKRERERERKWKRRKIKIIIRVMLNILKILNYLYNIL